MKTAASLDKCYKHLQIVNPGRMNHGTLLSSNFKMCSLSLQHLPMCSLFYISEAFENLDQTKNHCTRDMTSLFCRNGA